MKRLISILLASVMVFCACGKGKNDYGEAYTAAREQKTYTAIVNNRLTVESDGEEDTYNETVRYAQGNGILSAKRTSDEGYSEYYYKDGNIFFVSAEMGGYAWEAESAEFYAEFCFEKPFEYEFESGEKKDGAITYTVELSGADYKAMLLGINPYFDDIGIKEADFTRFVYSATVKDGKLVSYTYDFALNAKLGEQSAVITNVMSVTYEPTPDDVVMPSGYEGFIQSGGNILDISDDAFTQEVMLIIVEALYNSDGSRRDDFDTTYAQFVEMYGEETMSAFIGGIEEFNQSIGIGN